MKLGVQVPHFGPHASASAVEEVARIADDIGLDSLWVSDHVVFPSQANSAYPHSSKGLPVENLSPIFEALTTLSYVAAINRKARLGTSILLPGMRQPVLAAKVIASLDQLCGGRLILGLGAGWLEAEFELLEGVDFARRGAALEEIIRIWKTLWTDRVSSFDGEFFQFEEMIFDPLPAQRPGPPIWIGGNSKAAIRRAARIGDGWHGARLGPAELADVIATLGEEAEAHGRGAEEVEPSVTLVFRTGDEGIDRERLRDLVGDPGLIAEQIQRYEEVGAKTIVLGLDPRHDLDEHKRDLAILAEEILPRLDDVVVADA